MWWPFETIPVVLSPFRAHMRDIYCVHQVFTVWFQNWVFLLRLIKLCSTKPKKKKKSVTFKMNTKMNYCQCLFSGVRIEQGKRETLEK